MVVQDCQFGGKVVMNSIVMRRESLKTVFRDRVVGNEEVEDKVVGNRTTWP